MIGWLCISVFPFFNRTTGNNDFKKRPILVIGRSDSSDFTVLPVSRVTMSRYIDPIYDIRLDPPDYPLLNLSDVSYVRTHKQTVVNNASITKRICDVRNVYPDLYHDIVSHLQDFNKVLFDSIL